MNKRNKLVLYHANCLDGFASAWIVGHWFDFHHVEFQAVEYEQPMPDVTDRDVYIVDFSYKREPLLAAALKAKSITMLDHHAGALKHWGEGWQKEVANIPDNLVVVVDTTQSGVGVVWNFFRNEPGSHIHRPMPMLLRFIQDYDLYQHVFLQSRWVQAALMNGRLTPVTLESFDYFSRQLVAIENCKGEELYEAGKVILRAQQHLAEQIIKRSAFELTIDGHDILICPMPYELRDVAGELLYKDRAFSITFEERMNDGITKFSLRSDQIFGTDVLKIAEMFGGSGHEHSAGFVMTVAQGVRFRMLID